MKLRLAASACMVLAAHMLFIRMLWWEVPPNGPASASTNLAVNARAVVVLPSQAAAAQPESHAKTLPAPQMQSDARRRQEEGVGIARPLPDRYEPALAAAITRIPMPDAPLPPEGVELRVLVQIHLEGLAAIIDHAAPPQTPEAFAEVTELALRRGLLKLPPQALDQPGLAYCLRVRFVPDAAEPELAWLPGIAHTRQRCLRGHAPEARVLH